MKVGLIDVDGHRFPNLCLMKLLSYHRKRRVYVLTNYGSTKEQDLYRIYALRDMGYDPYVMIYEKPTALPETRKLQQWVNNKWFFRAVKDFKDFDPKKRGKTKIGGGSDGMGNR